MSILVVLDNVESLLRDKGEWREPRWRLLVETLLSHEGNSRTVLTSRIIPDGLPAEAIKLPIHSLSADETVLLARQYPSLGKLIKGSEEDRQLVLRALTLVQGHPELLKLVEKQAIDRETLKQHLDQAEKAYASGDTQLDAFFRDGESQLDPGHFLNALATWTRSIGDTLDPAARTLFHFLCCLEEPDRESDVARPIWPGLSKKLQLPGAQPDLEPLLAILRSVALIDGVEQYRVHPGVAEAARNQAGAEFQSAVDNEAAAFWRVNFQYALDNEAKGLGQVLVRAGRSAAPYLIRLEEWDTAATLLEHVVVRDQSHAVLAAVIPMLQHIADATQAVDHAGVLANALRNTGRVEDAEALLRDLIPRAVAQQQYRGASVRAGDLINILRATGRSEQALDLIDQKKEYTRRAGLGPWSQLADEAQRLQVLVQIGRNQEVLDAVTALRQHMASLSLSSSQEESFRPWNVREGILDTGRSAAMRLEAWETALELNNEILEIGIERGAPSLNLARTRFNDYGPLIRLGRLPEAHQLLLKCRRDFEQHGSPEELQAVFSALAELENTFDNHTQAANHERAALRYTYLVGDPKDCAISHFNLSTYLFRIGTYSDTSIAHRFTAAIIRLQTADGRFPRDIAALAHHLRYNPPLPTSFDHLCQLVEQTPGVRFRELFAKLPTTRAKSGDEALQIVLAQARGLNASEPESA